jgi:DNA transformation protein
MALSSGYTEYILDQLEESGSIRSRKMFGGLGIYVNDVFCAIVSSSNRFYLRVGPKNLNDFKKAGMTQFSGRGDAGMSYYEVPEHVLEDSALLSEWTSKARNEAILAKKK